MLTRSLMLAASLLVLGACAPRPESKEEAAPQPGLATTADITAADLGARIAELADDKYEGRGPGTEKGEAAAQWIADEMARIGLKPGANGSWFQTVDMVGQTVDPAASTFTATVNGVATTLAYAKDSIFWTKRQTENAISVADSDMVFVGYGVVAPEYGWNDYAGIDVKGKTVVMLVNDPGFHAGDASLFKGKAMTYYGRWTYKFEEAGRQGAAAAIIIHDTEGASYGWDVVTGSWVGEQPDLVRADGGASRTQVEGWMTQEAAVQLMKSAGLDLPTLRAAANKPGFKPVAIPGAKASFALSQTVTRRQSRNVAGVLEGATTPGEHMLYMAHWDHLGKKPTTDPAEDGIFNGAVDNATGVSMMLDIAEKFASGERPARSITFMAVTLEESGLLGSAFFAENPFLPLSSIVAGVNMDGVLPAGRSKDMIVVGSGASQLEDILKEILASQGRVATDDPEPQAGYFYRSDHISLAKKGVPMLYADGGVDLVEGGREAGLALSEAYRAANYHNVSDEYAPTWDLSGMAEDTQTLFELGRRIVTGADWPTWYPGNEFEAARKASLAAAAPAEPAKQP